MSAPSAEQVKYREEYLNSEHWATVRTQYRKSKLPQACVVCGATRVDLHHRTYQRIGRERLTDLVPLCREHHDEAHKVRAARKRPKGTATAKELAYIRRLGGIAPPETTRKQAKRLIARLQRARGRNKAGMSLQYRHLHPDPSANGKTKESRTTTGSPSRR